MKEEIAVDNFTDSNATSSKEREQLDYKQIHIFLRKTDEITEKSTTMEICKLIAEISDYETYHSSFFKDILSYLQKLLSSCISSKCDKNNSGFVNLHNYVAYEKKLLAKLSFA